jgi:acetyl esterase/lipase
VKYIKSFSYMLALLLALASANAESQNVMKDIAYGEAPAQKMDVYLPAHTEHAPVIFMVHGGGWRRGDKAAENVVKNKVARWVEQGYVFISVNYRMLPEADPLMQADDVARALAAAQTRAAEWGGDPDKFILMGHSAGAHLVALLGAGPARAQGLGARPWLGTVVLDSAAVDVAQIMQRRHMRLYDEAFGKDAAFWKSASPIQQLSAEAKPMLLVCSTTRRDKPCDAARAFAEQATALGVRAEVSGQALPHGEINHNLGLPGAYTDTVERFMRSLTAR